MNHDARFELGTNQYRYRRVRLTVRLGPALTILKREGLADLLNPVRHQVPGFAGSDSRRHTFEDILRFANSTNHGTQSAFAIASSLNSCSGAVPISSFFTGNSIFLPESVRGIALT